MSREIRLVNIALLGFLGVALWCESGAAQAIPGYQAKFPVQQPTKLDWIFPQANQSPTQPPAAWADWLKKYDSTQQSFELYVPQGPRSKDARPLILFISPSAQPAGWKAWQGLCQKHGAIFASPFRAGNDCLTEERFRIVMDVWSELRRHYVIDPDRTYLTGFSGGGRIACQLAMALPELCGGVAPLCAAGELREEMWLRQRVRDRLSVALVTGETDFNRGEVERFRGPELSELGVRTKVWVQPKLGHGIPSAATLNEVWDWLEADLPRRKELAAKYPTTRMPAQDTWTREEHSARLLAEGKLRVQELPTRYSGLMLMQGVLLRWPNTAAATEARQLLLRYEMQDRAWEVEDIAEQRKLLLARARGLDAYATGDLPPQYVKMRGAMLREAIQCYELIRSDGQDQAAVAHADERLPVLRKLAEPAP